MEMPPDAAPVPELVYAQASPLVAVAVALAFLAVAPYLVAVVDAAVASVVSGAGLRLGRAAVAPLRRAAVLASQDGTGTERSDAVLWAVAPATLAAVAVGALAVIPLSEGFAIADVRTGIVVFGAAEVLAMVAVYLHGWSANSAFSLVGAYRGIALTLSFMLLSMFVLIAVALPAESLSIGQVVESQRELWNVIRQPLGLPLFVIVALGAGFWGPLDLPVGRDIMGGTNAETSGPQRLVWGWARRAVLAVWALMGATAFLGGPLGPVLPGPAWLLLKTVALLVLLIWIGHRVGRVTPDRFVSLAWTVLLPLSFVGLIGAGLEALA